MIDVPVTLLREQTPMLKTLGEIALSSTPLGKKGPSTNPTRFAPIEQELPAPSDELLNHYLRWAGAPTGRYMGVLPPHLFSQFALPICSRQIVQTRYKIAGIVNQGCGVTVHSAMPRGQRLQVRSEVVDIQEDAARARIHQRLHIGTANTPNAVEVEFYTAFVLGKSEKKPRPKQATLELETVGRWDAALRSGLEFGILTGDLNPIHWVAPAGKLSPFKAMVLHGFGMFVRTFETLQNSGVTIANIDTRFVSPVKLPSTGVQVCRGVNINDDGSRVLQLRSADGQKLHAVGQYRAA